MSVAVQASKHPLKPEWVYADVEAGQSIYQIAGGAPVAAYINGREVPEEMHRLTCVKDGATVVLWPLPQDDGALGSVAGVIVAAAAVAVSAGALAPALGASFAAGEFAALAAGTAISVAGNMAINSLIPPQQVDQPNTPDSFNRLEALTGASNRTAAFKPIPRLYGTFRYFPPIPMTAKPFTEIKGDDQYLRMMVCLGYGPIEIGGQVVGDGYSKITEQSNIASSAIRIGDTDIGLFDEVEFEVGTPDQMTIYSNQIIETQPGFTTGFQNADLLTDDDPNTGSKIADFILYKFIREENESAIRTTDTDADEISIDLTGTLFSVDNDAKTRAATVYFKIEYREVGQTEWITEKEDFRVNSTKKETVRKGYRWKVPRGQYEVKLTRYLTTHKRKTAISNELTWSALRTIRSVQPFDVDGTVVMAMRIRATDQLNGRVEDLSVLGTSVLDVYNGQSWVKQATNNPAWAFADIWTGTANRRPLTKNDLDAQALKDWADYCEDIGWEYNGVFDSTGTTLERANEVAGAGLASWAFTPESKISVVRDIVQTVPRMVISPRNSFDFSFEVSAIEVPEALRVRFVDDFTWENTERLVFDDGFDESNAQKFETLEAKGVTNPDQAWKYGRYHLAQQRLRPERFTFKQDVQHLRYKRGDLLTINHDVILVGLKAGRIKNVVSDTEIEVDEIFFDEGENYGVKIQHQDGTVSTVTCTLGTDPDNKTVFLNQAVTKTNPDDLVIFGEAGKESIDVKVTAIEPEGDFVASITCVPSAPEILDALEGDIPQYDPLLTEAIDADNTRPRKPEITRIASDESVLLPDDDGSLRVRMLVEASVQQSPGWDQKYQFRIRALGDESWNSTDVISNPRYSFFDVDEGIEYEVQVRGVRNNLVTEWTESQLHTVVGKSSPPPDVEVLNAVQNGESVVFRWRKSVAPDIDGYEIRFGEPGNSSWNDSIKIAEAEKGNVVTEADVPPGTWRFYIKAVDTSGNYSRNATTRDLEVVTAFEDLRRTVHNPDWDTGKSFGFVRVGDVLEADNDLEAYFVTDTEDLGFDAKRVRVWSQVQVGQSNVDSTEDYGLVDSAVRREDDYGLLTDSVTETEDLGALLTGIPVSDPLVVYEIATRNEGEEWTDLDADIDRYGKITSSVTETEDYGLITDNEIEREVYDSLMGWTEWTRGEVDARYIKQRVRLRSDNDDESGLKLLRKFTTVVDVPERQERAQGLTVDPGGSTFTFDRRFHLRPVVTAVVESDDDLFPIRKSLDNSSVTFVVRDSAGNDVGTNNLDYIATGV